MQYFSWIVSGLSLFGSTFKSKRWINILSIIVCVFWFVFSYFFNFTTMMFSSYVNWPAFFSHIGLLISVIFIGSIIKRHTVLNAMYGVLSILIWSVFVDTIDYLLLFTSWSSGMNYFAYVLNGLVFNAPKCIIPMIISLAISISSVRLSEIQDKKAMFNQ